VTGLVNQGIMVRFPSGSEFLFFKASKPALGPRNPLLFSSKWQPAFLALGLYLHAYGCLCSMQWYTLPLLVCEYVCIYAWLSY